MKRWLRVVALLVALATVTFVIADEQSRRAQRTLEDAVERIRPLVGSSDVDPRVAAAAQEWVERLAALDGTLDRLAPIATGVGSPRMWTSEHALELEAVVRDVTPTLDELAKLALERRPFGPLPRCPKLMTSRHRTNLICAAAWVDPDAGRAGIRLLQALDVARMEDDGSYPAAAIHLADAGIVASAERSMVERRGRDEDAERALRSQFAPFLDHRFLPTRVGRALVDFVDDDEDRDLSPEDIVTLGLFLDDLQLMLTHGGEPSKLLLRTRVTPWVSFLADECSPARAAQRATILRF
jgi:hypothetical protein